LAVVVANANDLRLAAWLPRVRAFVVLRVASGRRQIVTIGTRAPSQGAARSDLAGLQCAQARHRLICLCLSSSFRLSSRWGR